MPGAVEAIRNEFRDEVPAIRRILERVPDDKLGWKPHPKSRSLGELAVHVANIPGLIENIATTNEFSPTLQAKPVPSAGEIVSAFDDNARKAEAALGSLTDEAAQQDWRLVFGGKEILRRTRAQALRTNVLNHIYHHRGQLSVYLRLLDVAVPMVYGPTADENPFLQTK
jgi:Uncharacterized protein conserved in bacteria